MLTAFVTDKNDQRTLIAKLRKTAEAVPSVTFSHERIRANKTRSESNLYRISLPSGKSAVSFNSNTGLAVYEPGLTALIRES